MVRNYHENKGIFVSGFGSMMIVSLFTISNPSIRFGPCFDNDSTCPEILGSVINTWEL
jgi:hypothetical protein